MAEAYKNKFALDFFGEIEEELDMEKVKLDTPNFIKGYYILTEQLKMCFPDCIYENTSTTGGSNFGVQLECLPEIYAYSIDSLHIYV